MQPDRLAELAHGGEELLEFRAVERLAVDIGIDLHAERAELVDRPLGLARAGVGRRQRHLRHPAGEMVAVLRGQLGETVVDDAAEILDLRGLGELLDRRQRIRQDLRVVGK